MNLTDELKRIAASRLAANSVADGACMVWRGAQLPNGYGVIKIRAINSVSLYTHRLSYACHKGPVPLGMFVCHSCDNRACIHPSHLFLGTHQENMDDMVQKGRHARGDNHGRRKLTSAEVSEVRRVAGYGISLGELCRLFGVASSGSLSQVVRGLKWQAQEKGAPKHYAARIEVKS